MENLDWINGIAIWVFMIGVTGFTIKSYVNSSAIKEDSSKKVNRVYQRIDEVKKDSETKFVASKVCAVLNEGLNAQTKEIKDDLRDIKKDIKELLTISKNGRG